MDWIRNEIAENLKAREMLKKNMGNVSFVERIKSWCQLKYWWRWLIAIFMFVLVILLAIFKDKIAAFFEPHKAAIVNLPGSWAIPIGVLIILSFPPLFGHEIVHLVIGIIWGLGPGFGITAAGTLLGELACYVVFRFFLITRARKVQESNTAYACLAKLMAQANLGILTLIRYSIIPGHVVTALEATVGVRVHIYALACILSLPQQFAIVYAGVELGTDSTTISTTSAWLQKVLSILIFIITALASWIAYNMVLTRTMRFYPEVKAEQGQREGTKDEEGGQLGRRQSTEGLVPPSTEDTPSEYAPTEYPPQYLPEEAVEGEFEIPPMAQGRGREEAVYDGRTSQEHAYIPEYNPY